MDRSGKYIKMCEKAEEIQKEWEPKNGDYVVYKNVICLTRVGPYPDPILYYGKFSKSWVVCDEEVKEIKEILGSDSIVWLPRQDQLQEMCDPPLDVLLMEFWEWLPKYELGVKYTSMEQLWLAFVMKRKYQKVWDEEKGEWIREEI